MDEMLAHVEQHKFIYSLLITIASFALLYWLSRYFATQKQLAEHKKRFDDHCLKFKEHQQEHYKLRDLVHEIDGHVKHLPSAEESQRLRETMARLEGRLEGMEPLFKQLLNNDRMLIENEIKQEKP